MLRRDKGSLCQWCFEDIKKFPAINLFPVNVHFFSASCRHIIYGTTMNGTTVTYCNDILIEIHHFVSCCQASLQLKWCDVYPILRHQWGQEHVDRHLPSIPASRYAPRVCPTPETSLIFSRFFSTQQLTLEHNLWLTPSWSWKYLQRIIKLLILSASLLQRHPLFFLKKESPHFCLGCTTSPRCSTTQIGFQSLGMCQGNLEWLLFHLHWRVEKLLEFRTEACEMISLEKGGLGDLYLQLMIRDVLGNCWGDFFRKIIWKITKWRCIVLFD